MEVNEFSARSNGGTELMLRRLHGTLDPALLSRFQIIPSRVRELDPDRIRVLWLHDLLSDETKKLSDPAFRRNFAKIVMVSDWQMNLFATHRDIPYSECRVIRNGIEPIGAHQNPRADDTLNIIYHTAPDRGLDLLLAGYERILQRHERLHLHVFSSLALYGWTHRDAEFENLYEHCRRHPHITYHGAQPNDVVREALKGTHIFAYPSTCSETSCLAAIEAMSASNIVVAPNIGGLVDTCSRWAFSYQWSERNHQHAQTFVDRLSDAITFIRREPEAHCAHVMQQKNYADRFYDWALLAKEWEQLLRELLNEA
jgi:UDP-glucose:(glucosyl)LPS alpha-1,2-glucosyltransferase